MAKQTGTIADPAAPPFATRGGQPTATPAGKPTDFTASNGKPNPSAEGGGGDKLADPTGTPGGGPRPRDLVADPAMNPAQRAGSPAQRVNPQSVPLGGTSIPVDRGAVTRGGVGTVGNSARPFKGLR